MTLLARRAAAEVGDVALELGLPRIRDGSDADRIDRGGHPFARIELGIEIGEPLPVAAALKRIGARLDRSALEPAQPLERVLRPADRLPELAVADDVDAGGRLPAHDLGDRIGQAFVIGRAIEGLARLPVAEKILQSGRADQAAHMGGEDALGALLHARALRVGASAPRHASYTMASPRHRLSRPGRAVAQAGTRAGATPRIWRRPPRPCARRANPGAFG